MRHCRVLALAAGALACASAPAAAQSADASGAPAAPSGFWDRATLLGDIGGLRLALGAHGITLSLSETSEVLGNVTGGVHRGAAYDGETTMSLSLDTAQAFGWTGGTLFISALQTHGRNLSADNLDTLQTASGIEAERTTRLWELWYDQAFLGGKLDVKLGQISADQEFMFSQYSALYVNTVMGWPSLPSADLYAGGPAYPLSSLGVRVRAHANDAVTVLAGVFDDNPPGGAFSDDSQLRGREASGTAFNRNTGALWLAEVQYAVHQSPAESCVRLSCGLPGIYKLGAWYDSGRFPDQHFGTDGLSLANPASNGDPLMHRGDFSLYALADQMVWRQAGGPRAVGVFARMIGAPANQNLVTSSLNAGVNVTAPLPGRGKDTLGIGFGWTQVSPRAAALDRDTAGFSATAYPVRGSEEFIELTYQLQMAPWWIVQPDLQYVFNPGGGIPNPNNPSHVVGNELVLGVRTVVTF
ncbi:MAG TPA: carbohydrate porin [Acetobacteraceae bacterium]|nr:carbohydrate porin [Acetobacteraceae bacterium]